MSLRERVYLLLEDEERTAPGAVLVRTALAGLIVLSVVATVLDSMPDLAPSERAAVDLIEALSMSAFVVEYALRVWVAVEDRAGRWAHPVLGRLRYMATPSAIVDLVTILPFLLDLVIGEHLVVFRLVRVLRILKVTRYAPSLLTLELVLYNERRALLSALLVVAVVVVLAAGFMHMAEATAQPAVFGTLPKSIYWATITVTTVGYGDAIPSTPAGKLIAAITALFGIGTLALPTAILGAGLIRELQKQDFIARAAIVARVPAFRHLEPAEVAEVTARLQLRVLPPRYTVIRRGEHPEAMYFIDEGRVVLRQDSRRVTLGPGAIFGEAALLQGRPRDVTVVTLTRCRLLELGAGDFHRLIADNSRLRGYILDEHRRTADEAAAVTEPSA